MRARPGSRRGVDERDAGLFDEDVLFLLGMTVGDLERDAMKRDRAVVVHDQWSFTSLDDPLPGEISGTLLTIRDGLDDQAGLHDWPGIRCRLSRVPGLAGCDSSGKHLVRALLVMVDVELVDLSLELLDAPSDGLFVQLAEQGLVEPFVLALCGRLVGLPGGRLDPQRGHVDDELALHPTARWIQRGSVVGEQTLKSPATRGALVERRDRCFSDLAAHRV